MRSPLAQPLTLACRARPSARARLQQTGDEAVLLDLASEYYFGLDAVGTRLWRLLEHDPGLRNAFDVLMGEYDVSADTLEHDLLAVIAQLVDAGLVTIE